MKSSFVIILLFVFNIGISQTCKGLPESFPSYSEAQSSIKGSKFTLEDSCDTSKSSWIRGAFFYSCDGSYGYLILSTSRKSYIHKGIPLNLWNEFKKAGSYGGFYNSKIKGKYQLSID